MLSIKLMAKVLCLGDSCVDIIIPYDKKDKSFFNCGGANSNSANILGKLGTNVAFIGKAGNDEYGIALKQNLIKNHVDVDNFILNDNMVTTQIRIELDENNDRHPYLYTKDNPSYLQIYKEDLDKIDLSETQYILTNGMMLFQNPAAENISDFLIKCHNKGIRILLDINYRVETINQDRKYLDKVISISDYLFGSIEDDFLPLTNTSNIDDAINKLLNNNVIIARNSKGSTVYTSNQTYHYDSPHVEVVNTIGAGDAHNAGFIYGLVNDMNLEECNKQACLVAAEYISKKK